MTKPKDQASPKTEGQTLGEFLRHDWEETKHDVEELRHRWQELREQQKEGTHPPKPGTLHDYKPEHPAAPEEEHGWSLEDPHSGTGHGHREN